MIALLFGIGLILYVALAILIVKLIGKFTRSKVAKYIVIAVFVLIPSWDILPGRLYFANLCREEAGTKVFKVVQTENKFFTGSGQPDEKKLGDRYVSSFNVDRRYSKLLHITRIENSIRDNQNAETLGTAIDFAYYGGWISAYLFAEGPPLRCPQHREHEIFALIWREVFKPKSGSKE